MKIENTTFCNLFPLDPATYKRRTRPTDLFIHGQLQIFKKSSLKITLMIYYQSVRYLISFVYDDELAV